MGLAVGDHQAAQVQLVVLHQLRGGQLQGDGGNGLASISAQGDGGGGPALSLLAGVLNGQVDRLGGVLFKDQGNLSLGGVICRGLVVGQGDAAVCSHIQFGLVEVHCLAAGQRAVHGQGGAAVVSADLGVVEVVPLAVHIAEELGAIVPIQLKPVLVSGLHPPLPGGENVLKGQVGPLHVPRDPAIAIVLHAVAVVEVGGKGGAVDHGFLHNVLGEALEVDGVVVRDVIPLHSAGGVFSGIFGGGGVVNPLPFLGFPLVSHFVAAIGLVELLMVPVRTPNGEGGVGLAILVYSVVAGFDVGAKLPLAAFHAHKYHFIGIQAQVDGMLFGVFQSGAGIPVVQEDGVGNMPLGLVPDPAAVVAVECVLVGNAAAFGGGVVPLDVNALFPHILEHFPEQRYIRGIDGGFLVDEVAVKTIVFGQIHQLLGIGEAAVLSLVQPLLGVLRRSGDEVLCQGDDTVLVSGVGGGSHGDGDDAILFVG